MRAHKEAPVGLPPCSNCHHAQQAHNGSGEDVRPTACDLCLCREYVGMQVVRGDARPKKFG